MRILLLAAALTAAPALADTETFFGWSRDGTWFAWQRVSGPNDLVELHFCATDPDVPPTWPAAIAEMEQEKVERQSCASLTDPNRAPMGWQKLLKLPKPSFAHGKVRVLGEVAYDGENPGFVVEAAPDKRTVCYVSGLRESSKITQVWWHDSGRWVAAVVDGRFAHCDKSLKEAAPQKPEKPKRGRK